MYSPLHAAAGLTLVALAPHPAIGIPLALASHYLLDAVPHGDMRKPPHVLRLSEGRRLLVTELFDLPLAAIVVWKLTTLFATINPWYLLVGAVTGILPDLLWGGLFVLEKLRWTIPGLRRFLTLHHRWHEWIHIKERRDIPFYAGILYHVAVIAGILVA